MFQFNKDRVQSVSSIVLIVSLCANALSGYLFAETPLAQPLDIATKLIFITSLFFLFSAILEFRTEEDDAAVVEEQPTKEELDANFEKASLEQLHELLSEATQMHMEVEKDAEKWGAHIPYTHDENEPFFTWEKAVAQFREETALKHLDEQYLRIIVGWFANDLAKKTVHLKGYAVNKYEPKYCGGSAGIYVVDDGEHHAFAAINEEDAKRQYLLYAKDSGIDEEEILENISITRTPDNQVINIVMDGGCSVSLFAYQWYEVETAKGIIPPYRLVWSSLF